MVDLVDQATRSRLMAGVRSRNTKPELLVRRALHARGFRYHLHVPGLPGKQDLVFPRYRAIAMIHGCFWHGHDYPLFRVPGTRKDSWNGKIARNRARDQELASALRIDGWRLATVWECSLRGPRRMDFEALVECISKWLTTDPPELELHGNR